MKVIPPVIIGGGPTRGIAETVSDPPDKEEIKKKLSRAKTSGKSSATAPARKRTPKPTITPEVREILNSWLPLLSLDPDIEKSGRVASEASQAYERGLLDEPLDEMTYEALSKEMVEEEEFLRELCRTLRAAIAAGLGRDAADVPDRINEFVGDVRPVFWKWTGNDRMFEPNIVLEARGYRDILAAWGTFFDWNGISR